MSILSMTTGTCRRSRTASSLPGVMKMKPACRRRTNASIWKSWKRRWNRWSSKTALPPWRWCPPVKTCVNGFITRSRAKTFSTASTRRWLTVRSSRLKFAAPPIPPGLPIPASWPRCPSKVLRQRAHHDARGCRDDVLVGWRIFLFARVVHGDHQRRAAGWPGHTDIVDGAIGARARLVGYAPSGRHSGADALVAGQVAAHPCFQLLALRRRQATPQQQLLQALRHRRGAGRIARFTRNRAIEFRFPAFQLEYLVADAACKGRDSARATQYFHQEICSAVVAVLQGGSAQCRDCHAIGQMFFRQW